MGKRASVAAIWLLLAALFLLGSDVLLWTTILEYTLADWVVRAIGYPALAVLVLDIAVRYRIRDIYDAMLLCAMYGVLASLLISPTVAFAHFPQSLLTRVLGGHTLLGFEMLGFFLVLTAGHIRRYRLRLLAVAAWLGFYWGIWMRWMPELGTLFETVSVQTMAAYLSGFFALAMVLWMIASHADKSLEPLDFRLPRRGWPPLLAALTGLYAYQSIYRGLTVWMLVVAVLLLFVCWAVLWYRREEAGETLLDNHLPPTPLSPLWVVASVVLFAGTAIIAFRLPLVGTQEYNQFWLMEMGFAAVGSLWLPLVAVVLAMRGVDYQMRTNRLL